MKSKLKKYLSLERKMMRLDGEERYIEADAIRDELDKLWYGFSDREIEKLNNQ